MATENDVLQIKRRHSAQLLQQPGVCGVGVEKDAAQGFVLAVHLDASQPKAGAGLPASIDGAPVKVIRSGPFLKQ